MIEILGSLIILIGAIFLLLASLGIYRMPDSYDRIQTGTKATTLGMLLILLGITFYHPGWIWKMIVLMYFVLITNPVSSHALARAAHKYKICKTDSTVVDQLEEVEQQSKQVKD